MESRLDTSLGSVTLTVFLCLASVLLRLGAAAGFRSLVPLTSRGTDAPPGLTLGHSGIFATPPGLLLSGRKSLSCSCLSQVDGTVQGSSVHSPNTTGDPPHYDSFSPVVDSGGISRRAHFCCSDKDGAFQSVYDAPVGIAFASIGDTGLPGGELRRVSTRLVAAVQQQDGDSVTLGRLLRNATPACSSYVALLSFLCPARCLVYR